MRSQEGRYPPSSFSDQHKMIVPNNPEVEGKYCAEFMDGPQ